MTVDEQVDEMSLENLFGGTTPPQFDTLADLLRNGGMPEVSSGVFESYPFRVDTNFYSLTALNHPTWGGGMLNPAELLLGGIAVGTGSELAGPVGAVIGKVIAWTPVIVRELQQRGIDEAFLAMISKFGGLLAKGTSFLSGRINRLFSNFESPLVHGPITVHPMSNQVEHTPALPILPSFIMEVHKWSLGVVHVQTFPKRRTRRRGSSQ